MRGADILAQMLAEDGQSILFSLSGNQIMPVYDAALDARLRIIHTRHEGAAGFMAEGYAQISGKVGVALLTAGSGLGNGIAPLITSRASQTPLLLLSGDSPVAADGRGAFQEMDQPALTRSLTKLSARLTDPDTIGQDLRTALDLARSGQPGPVHLALPADILVQEAAATGPATNPRPSPVDASPIAAALEAAKRPLILLGPALAATRTRTDLTHLNAPVLAMESPRGVNDPALGQIAQAFTESDLVITIGKPVDFSLGMGSRDIFPKARWITAHASEADSDRARRNLGDRLEFQIEAPAHALAQALAAQHLPQPERSDWCTHVDTLIRARVTPPPSTGGKITSATLCEAVQALIGRARDPIVVCDGGEIGQWAQALTEAPRRLVNGVSGTIGGGIPYAIGAKAAAPASDVIAIMGDGTAGFHFMEFETAVREALPFVAVIGNDRRWNAEHQIQVRDFGPERAHSCTLSDARYDEMAQAMGGFGAHVTKREDLPEALEAALASGKPACVNVDIEGLAAPRF